MSRILNEQRGIWFKAVLILMVSFVLAEASLAEKETTQKLDDIVVTATKTPKKLENVPAVVTVIGHDEIEATNVAIMTAFVPGIQLKRSIEHKIIRKN